MEFCSGANFRFDYKIETKNKHISDQAGRYYSIPHMLPGRGRKGLRGASARDKKMILENRKYLAQFKKNPEFNLKHEGYSNTNFTVLQRFYFFEYTLFKVSVDMTIKQTRINFPFFPST